MSSISDKALWFIVIALIGAGLAIADMNWPAHMDAPITTGVLINE